MRAGRTGAVLASGIGLALLAAACGSSGHAGAGAASRGTAPSASGVVTGATATMLIPSDPGNLNPLTTVTGTTRGLDYFAYDSLIDQTPGGKLVSGLATSWKQSGNTYTFSLRTGVTCSDGAPMTPATVADNINFLSNPKNKSPLLDLFIPPDAKASARGTTLTIKLAQPFPFFLEDLTGVWLVCGKGLADPSSLAEATDGTGPYVLSSAVPGSQYTFTLRKGYTWGPGGTSTATPGLPAKLVVKVVSDPTTEANLLLQGEANLANIQGLASKPLSAAHLFHESQLAPLGELWFNQAPGHATANQKVRTAIISALDLPELGQVIGQGLGSAPTGLVTLTPKACPGDTVTGTLPAYSTSRAASLLDQAGWTVGPGGTRAKAGKPLSLTLLYANDIGGDPPSAFELAAQELQKVGIQVHLVGDSTTQLESVIFGTGSWDIVDVPLGINTPSEAVPFVSGPAAPSGENFSHIDNAAYTALASRAAALPGTSGCSDWDQAEQSLFRAVDVVPFENATEPFWGKGITFGLNSDGVVPTSLRMLKG